MQRALVLDRNKKPLMPCHPARARQLLKTGRAAVYRRYPFTIILKDREGGEVQPVELKVDPGSRTTGLAVAAQFEGGWTVVWAANLEHRGLAVKAALDKRRAVRRGRRTRKTRYRPPRFDNRRREKGWLPPSLMSRVQNVRHWADRLAAFVPLSQIAVETVRFDTQLMQNPHISGVKYQQGELAGYEVREYLLEKWGRKCAYCDAENVPLEIEHIRPKSRNGSNRTSNLLISCHACNQAKGNRDVREFLAHDPARLKKILAQASQPLSDAAAVNATRYAIGDALKSLGVPVTFWSGGRTKYNRIRLGYPKDHWLDAACVGDNPAQASEKLQAWGIRAVGRGRRQMCAMDKYGFPRTRPKAHKQVHGFQTGDLVKAVVPKGKRAGTHIGRVAVRTKGSFRVGRADGISWHYCTLIQRANGYEFFGTNGNTKQDNAPPFLPPLKKVGFLEADS